MAPRGGEIVPDSSTTEWPSTRTSSRRGPSGVTTEPPSSVTAGSGFSLKVSAEDPPEYEEGWLDRFVSKYYAPFLMKPFVKIVVILFFWPAKYPQLAVLGSDSGESLALPFFPFSCY